MTIPVKSSLSGKRYYLNGIDWVMAALDRLNKKHTGLGNHSGLVLVLKGYLDSEVFQAELVSKLSKNPFFRGRIKRAWNLAPYWQPESLSLRRNDYLKSDEFVVNSDCSPCRGGNSSLKNALDIRIFKFNSHNKNSLDFFICKCAKTPFKDDHTMLGFDLVYYEKHTYLIMRFDHRMFDARGAEALLESILNNDNTGINFLLPSQGPQLDSWKTRFLSGQCVNRFLRKMYHENNTGAAESGPELFNHHTGAFKVVQSGIRCFDGYDKSSCGNAGPGNGARSHKGRDSGTRGNGWPGNPGMRNSHCFFYTNLSEDITAAIGKNSVKTAGYLMEGVYILGCAAKAFDSLFGGNGGIGGKMLIPINVDMRGTKFDMQETFFNHLSFMLFEAEHGLSLSDYIKSLKEQFIDQIKNKIPYHFINASLLMRIMPLELISTFMDRKMTKLPASFSFSYIGEQAFNLKTVHNHKVVNLFHLPLVPVNPGIGVFFTRFNKRLNMVISAYNNSLGVDDGIKLKEKIISGLVMG